MRELSVDVLIIGLGPTGLATAASLTAHGKRVFAYEKRENYTRLKDISIQQKTLSSLQGLGIDLNTISKYGSAQIKDIERLMLRSIEGRALFDCMKGEASVDYSRVKENEVTFDQGGITTRVCYKKMVLAVGGHTSPVFPELRKVGIDFEFELQKVQPIVRRQRVIRMDIIHRNSTYASYKYDEDSLAALVQEKYQFLQPVTIAGVFSRGKKKGSDFISKLNFAFEVPSDKGASSLSRETIYDCLSNSSDLTQLRPLPAQSKTPNKARFYDQVFDMNLHRCKEPAKDNIYVVGDAFFTGFFYTSSGLNSGIDQGVRLGNFLSSTGLNSVFMGELNMLADGYSLAVQKVNDSESGLVRSAMHNFFEDKSEAFSLVYKKLYLQKSREMFYIATFFRLYNASSSDPLLKELRDSIGKVLFGGCLSVDEAVSRLFRLVSDHFQVTYDLQDKKVLGQPMVELISRYNQNKCPANFFKVIHAYQSLGPAGVTPLHPLVRDLGLMGAIFSVKLPKSRRIHRPSFMGKNEMSMPFIRYICELVTYVDSKDYSDEVKSDVHEVLLHFSHIVLKTIGNHQLTFTDCLDSLSKVPERGSGFFRPHPVSIKFMNRIMKIVNQMNSPVSSGPKSASSGKRKRNQVSSLFSASLVKQAFASAHPEEKSDVVSLGSMA